MRLLYFYAVEQVFYFLGGVKIFMGLVHLTTRLVLTILTTEKSRTWIPTVCQIYLEQLQLDQPAIFELWLQMESLDVQEDLEVCSVPGPLLPVMS